MGLLLTVIVDHSLIPCTSKQVFVEKRSAVKLPAMPTCTVMSTKAGDHKIAVFKPVALQIFGAMCPANCNWLQLIDLCLQVYDQLL